MGGFEMNTRVRDVDPAALELPESFESPRLLIQQTDERYARQMFEAVCESIHELRPWMPWAKDEPTLENARVFLVKGHEDFLARKDFPFLLFRKSDRQLVGASGLHAPRWDVPSFEVGYWVRTSLAGQGYITEAVIAITGFAFAHLGANRVWLRCGTLNERSWKVAERAGFQLEGILRNECRHTDGSLRDTKIYAKVRS
jgi:RimJ/RimL family protein N-acetyltransferase